LPDEPKIKYTVRPLGDQDRAAFECGNEALDRYFLERAARDVRENLSAVFVLLAENDLNTVLGFYTLSSHDVEAEELPERLQKRTGKCKRVGVTLLGRLALAAGQQGKGLGAVLLMDALKKSLDSSQNVSSFAVVVDAKDEDAFTFYEKFGFVKLTGNRLFLPMKTIAKLFPSPSR
jgi:predicted GNAT family N-acyltransferase